MKYLLLSVLVVCMIGLTVQSAFAQPMSWEIGDDPWITGTLATGYVLVDMLWVLAYLFSNLPTLIVPIIIGIVIAVFLVKRHKQFQKTTTKHATKLEEYENEYLTRQERFSSYNDGRFSRSSRKPVETKESESNFCENCGNSLKPTAKFCGGCGTQRS